MNQLNKNITGFGAKLTLLILTAMGTYALLVIPFGKRDGMEYALIDGLVPKEVNNGFDPVFAFCLYSPVLLIIESFFMKVPFTFWQRVFLIVQFTGVVLTLPFVIFLPLGIPFGHAQPNMFTLVIILWAFLMALWHLFLIIPPMATKRWVSWLFN